RRIAQDGRVRRGGRCQMIAAIGRLLIAIAAVGVLSIDDWSNEGGIPDRGTDPVHSTWARCVQAGDRESGVHSSRSDRTVLRVSVPGPFRGLDRCQDAVGGQAEGLLTR